jgi:phosphoglycerate dehydrogenase-like enzyme
VLLHIHHPEYTLWNLPPALPARLRERFEARGVCVFAAPLDVSFEEGLASAEVLIGRGLNAANFPSARLLRWVHSHAAGIGGLLFPAFAESDVILTNARGVHAPAMAEHLLGMMLALVRKLHRARDFQRDGAWGQEALSLETPLFDEIHGRALGIVGLGAVGGALAERARALGMRTLGVRRRPALGDHGVVDEVRGTDQLPWLLGESEFVANCLPHTARTERMFDAAAFARMRPGAYFLNVGRGDTVDETALADALESGRLAGAGLDVTAIEPLPAESRLYRIPSVLLTPHVSGASARHWERASALIEENLRRYLDGEPLLNLVDKREGY